MNLVKAIGTIGGLTMVSRVLGFARDMIGSARSRRQPSRPTPSSSPSCCPTCSAALFGEGAFASGFVPLFSQRLNGEGGHGGGAQRFAERGAGGVPADPDR